MGPRLRELAPVARGGQEAISRNLIADLCRRTRKAGIGCIDRLILNGVLDEDGVHSGNSVRYTGLGQIFRPSIRPKQDSVELMKSTSLPFPN